MPNVESSAQHQAREYVLDSYALLAFFEAETGSEQVYRLLEEAKEGKCKLSMCAVNLGEVIYIVERARGLRKAQETLARIDELPIKIVNADRAITLAAAHIKANCSIAYADCFAAGLAHVKKIALLTGDREFRKIKPESNVRIVWLVE